MKDFTKEDNFAEMVEARKRRSRKRAAMHLFVNGMMSSLDYKKVGKAVPRAKASLKGEGLEAVDGITSTDFPVL